jgi:hypothetical protein
MKELVSGGGRGREAALRGNNSTPGPVLPRRQRQRAPLRSAGLHSTQLEQPRCPPRLPPAPAASLCSQIKQYEEAAAKAQEDTLGLTRTVGAGPRRVPAARRSPPPPASASPAAAWG